MDGDSAALKILSFKSQYLCEAPAAVAQGAIFLFSFALFVTTPSCSRKCSGASEEERKPVMT